MSSSESMSIGAAAEALQILLAGMRADATPCSLASSTVSRITSGSPAWKPQATFAEVSAA